MTDIQVPERGHKDNEIDLLQLAKVLWHDRKTIIKYVLIFAFIGLLIAIFSPKEYTTSVTFVPQIERGQTGMGNLAGLVSLAGINLNAGDYSYISPNVYPQIISSIPFQLELMNTMINVKNLDDPISIFDYYTKHVKPNPIIKYTIGLPSLILKSLQGKTKQITEGDLTVLKLTKDQKKVIDIFKKIISIELNEKRGYVVLSCKMPEALPSAQIVQKAQEILQQQITEFKIQKATANLEFIQNSHKEALYQYNEAQKALAKFSDQNKNVSTAMAQTEIQHLNNDYNLSFTIYSDVAKQLEQAKIKVKEDTPVFTIIEPAFMPLERSKPQRTIILFIWSFLGGIVGVMVCIVRSFQSKPNQEEK